MRKRLESIILCVFLCLSGMPSLHATYLFIPMDKEQTNHLKAYGLTYWALTKEVDVSWLLNYRGGSFLCAYHEAVENECLARDVRYEVMADGKVQGMLAEIMRADVNMSEVKLTKAPRIAV